MTYSIRLEKKQIENVMIDIHWLRLKYSPNIIQFKNLPSLILFFLEKAAKHLLPIVSGFPITIKTA